MQKKEWERKSLIGLKLRVDEFSVIQLPCQHSSFLFLSTASLSPLPFLHSHFFYLYAHYVSSVIQQNIFHHWIYVMSVICEGMKGKKFHVGRSRSSTQLWPYHCRHKKRPSTFFHLSQPSGIMCANEIHKA